MAKGVSTYMVGSPNKHTIYSVHDGSVVLQHELPAYLKKTTPTPEERTEPKSSTPPIDISTPNRFTPLTGECSDYPTAAPSNALEIQTDIEPLFFDFEE